MSLADNPLSELSRPDGRWRYDVLFLLLAFVFIYLQVFILPATPIYYESDHVNLLNDVKRMLDGEVIYRDFFEFVLPGSHCLYYVLMLMFGTKYWIVNIVIIGHGLLTVYLGLQISRHVIGERLIAYLPSALYLFFGFRWFGVDGEHRMISPVLAYLAILILLPARTLPRIGASAAACALSSFFTQQRGVLMAAAIGLCLLFEFGLVDRNWKRFFYVSAVFCFVFLVLLALCILPFMIAAGPEVFLDRTVLFLRAYTQDPANNSLQSYVLTIVKIGSIGSLMTIVSAFYMALVPFIYVVGLIVIFVRGRGQGYDAIAGILLVCLGGLFLALGTSGPNVPRLFQVSLPALIVFVWLASTTRLASTNFIRLALLSLIVFGLGLSIRIQTAWDTRTLETASGRLVFLSPITSERYEWLLANALPGDAVYETYNSHVNFPLGLKNPTRMSVLLNSGYSPPIHVGWAIEDLKRSKPRYIIWDGTWTAEVDQLAEGERLKPLYQFMQSNYRLVKSFTPYDGRDREIWERIRDEDLPATGLDIKQ